MTVKFTPGLKPNDPSKPRLYGRMFLRDVAPPATVDYSGFSPIGMLGNDNVGDCVEAGAGQWLCRIHFTVSALSTLFDSAGYRGVFSDYWLQPG